MTISSLESIYTDQDKEPAYFLMLDSETTFSGGGGTPTIYLSKSGNKPVKVEVCHWPFYLVKVLACKYI